MAKTEVEVVIWDPVGYGSSSFGHVSTTIRDGGKETTYSLGPKGCDIEDAASYAAHQYFRNGYGLVLKLTPPQLQTVISWFRTRLTCEYAFIALTPGAVNNCASPIQRALAVAGIKLAGFSLMPKALGVNLVRHGLVLYINQYFGDRVEHRIAHMPWSLPATSGYPWAAGR